jgi:hypothetical protein
MASTNLVEETSSMKREFEFAGNFALSALLLAGSFAVAQSATTATAKKAGPTTPAAVTGSSGQGAPAAQTKQAAVVTNSQTAEAVVPPATPQNQPSSTTKPKTMVSADKRTIPVPQL